MEALLVGTLWVLTIATYFGWRAIRVLSDRLDVERERTQKRIEARREEQLRLYTKSQTRLTDHIRNH